MSAQESNPYAPRNLIGRQPLDLANALHRGRVRPYLRGSLVENFAKKGYLTNPNPGRAEFTDLARDVVHRWWPHRGGPHDADLTPLETRRVRHRADGHKGTVGDEIRPGVWEITWDDGWGHHSVRGYHRGALEPIEDTHTARCADGSH